MAMGKHATAKKKSNKRPADKQQRGSGKGGKGGKGGGGVDKQRGSSKRQKKVCLLRWLLGRLPAWARMGGHGGFGGSGAHHGPAVVPHCPCNHACCLWQRRSARERGGEEQQPFGGRPWQLFEHLLGQQ